MNDREQRLPAFIAKATGHDAVPTGGFADEEEVPDNIAGDSGLLVTGRRKKGPGELRLLARTVQGTSALAARVRRTDAYPNLQLCDGGRSRFSA
jgi:hypothetical protein